MDNRLVTEQVQYTVTETKFEQTLFSEFWKKRLDERQGVSFVADLSELVYFSSVCFIVRQLMRILFVSHSSYT
jgi:hypothetical protein